MKRRRPEDDSLGPASPSLPQTVSKAEVQGMISKEVRSAVEQGDIMMKTLMKRIQETESEPKYDDRIKKLQAHVRKVKRRGDAVFVYIRKNWNSGMSQNQQKSLDSPTVLSTGADSKNLSLSNGEFSGDSMSSSAATDCEGAAGRKPKEGFWQSLRSKKQFVDLTDEGQAFIQHWTKTDSPLPTPTFAKKEDAKESPVVKIERPCPEEKSEEEESQASLMARLPVFPDTPFPTQLPLVAATKNLPQKPLVKVARIENPQGIALLWNVEEDDPHAAEMDSYHIYVTQEYHDGTLSHWKTMGIIKAMPLPMACRVSDRSKGKTLYFIIIGRDVYGRYGPYSDIQTVPVMRT